MKTLFLSLAIFITLFSCSKNDHENVESLSLSEQYLHSIKGDEIMRINWLEDTLKRKKIDFEDFKSYQNNFHRKLDSIRNDLIYFCGGFNEFGDLNNPNNEECVNTFFLHMDYGDNLKRSIGDFENFLLAEFIPFNKLTKDANEIEILKFMPSYRDKTFIEYNFDNIPLHQALNRLTIFELHITILEKEYLRMLLNRN